MPALTIDEAKSLAASLPDKVLAELGMTEQEIANIKGRAIPKHRYRLTDLWIQTKDRRVIPFVCNGAQRRFLHSHGIPIDTDAMDLSWLRPIILKARQEGFSTLILALIFLNTINNANTNSVVIAHDLESTIKLFRMVFRFYAKLPEDNKPLTQYASKREIFWPTLNSRISVETAGKGTAGRGDTIHNLAISEFAFWETDKVLTGLLQAIPAGGAIAIESTANGIGGDGAPFYEEYALASGKIEETKDGRLESIFRPHFYPWFWHEDYQTPAVDGFERTPEEISLAERYELTDDQLQWRRNKLREPGMGRARFQQEYPSNDDEAFRASGMMFFDNFEEKPPLVVVPIFTPDDPPPHWYTARGGLDWGFADPFAYVITVIDERGRKHVLESYQEARLTNEEQANLVCDALARWKIPKSRFVLICDGSMWNHKTINGVPFPPDIEAYLKAGLNCEPAAEGEEANKFRNNKIRDNLDDHESGLVIYRGYNGPLLRSLKAASHDPNPLKREKLLHDENSHLIVALGNAVATYDTPTAIQPAIALTPQQAQDARQLEYEKAVRLAQEASLRDRNKRMGIIPKVGADRKEVRDDNGRLVWIEDPHRARPKTR